MQGTAAAGADLQIRAVMHAGHREPGAELSNFQSEELDGGARVS